MLSTTATRTKQVVIKRIAGARLSTVSSSITWIVELSPSGLTHFSGPAVRSCGTLSVSGRLPASSARAAAGSRQPASDQRPAASSVTPARGSAWPSRGRRSEIADSRFATRQFGDLQSEILFQACFSSQRYRFRRVPAGSRSSSSDGLAGLGGQLLKDLPEGRRGALRMGLLADAGDAIDLQRIGHFGQGLGAAGRDRHQQQLVAAAQQLHLLAGPQRGAAEDLEDLLGQQQRSARSGLAHGPGDDEEKPQHDRQAAADRDHRAQRRTLAGGILVVVTAQAQRRGESRCAVRR